MFRPTWLEIIKDQYCHLFYTGLPFIVCFVYCEYKNEKKYFPGNLLRNLELLYAQSFFLFSSQIHTYEGVTT